MEHEKYLKEVNTEINNVSPSFCVAKWKQVTMHLQNGHNHSCHHPATHYVSVDEIKRNPTALHNSEFKKQQRKLMLDGQRPSECDYCWRVEDTPGNHYSDRTYKSSDATWARPYINEITQTPWYNDIDPSYVEVSFGNVCNFKCSYCNPGNWGGANPNNGNLDLYIANLKAIIDKYLEIGYKNFKFFFSGGEPTAWRNFIPICEFLKEYVTCTLAVNTNLSRPLDWWQKAWRCSPCPWVLDP